MLLLELGLACNLLLLTIIKLLLLRVAQLGRLLNNLMRRRGGLLPMRMVQKGCRVHLVLLLLLLLQLHLLLAHGRPLHLHLHLHEINMWRDDARRGRGRVVARLVVVVVVVRVVLVC